MVRVILTWPMAKRLKLFGITYLVGKISRSNFYVRVHWLSEYTPLSSEQCNLQPLVVLFIFYQSGGEIIGNHENKDPYFSQPGFNEMSQGVFSWLKSTSCIHRLGYPMS